MRLKKFMRILGVVAIAIMLGISVYLILLSIAFDGFTKDLKESSIYGKDLIRTEVGDEFKIEYKTGSFPKFITSVLIYNKNHKFHKDSYGSIDSINYYTIREYYVRPEFRLIVENETVRAYEIIVLKEDGTEFKREYIYRTLYSSYEGTGKDKLDFWIKYYDTISFSGGTDSLNTY